MASFNNKLITKEAVIEAVSNYTGDIYGVPFDGMATNVLFNPDKFQYSKLGGSTFVRFVTPGNFADYDGTFNPAGLQGSVKLVEFKATIDRKLVVNIDWKDEYNSILTGQGLSGAAVMKFSMKKFSVEGDMRNISSIYAGTKEENRHINTEPNFSITEDNIIKTLINIKTELKNNQVPDSMPVYVFMDTQTYANLESALVKNYALAAMIEKKSITKDVSGNGSGLYVYTDVSVFGNNLYIIPVIKDRMKTLITSLDGTSPGQEDGGVVADDTSAGAADINILAVPEEAAVCSLRHGISLAMSPYINPGFTQGLNDIVDPLNKILADTGSVVNIGINQNSDGFKYVTRLIFGTVLMPDYKDTIIAVTTTPAVGD